MTLVRCPPQPVSMCTSSSTTRHAVPTSRTMIKPPMSRAVALANPVRSRQSAVDVSSLVKIRFARYGRIHSPFYRVIAIDSRKKRSGRPAQFLGWYNPMTKETQLDAPSIRKWLENGAQPTDTVRRLLAKALIIDASKVPERQFKKVEKTAADDTAVTSDE